MPEGDVLRLTAARLTAALRGLPLVRAELRWPSAGGADLTGATALETSAYGKHLFTRFDDGRTLHTHLRMDGYWRVHRTGSRDASARNAAIRAVLATEAWTATGWHLGMLDLLRTHDEQRILNGLGPDVLGADFPTTGLPDASARLVREPDRPLCAALLDQRTVAGIGTIWMAESLFARRLFPWTTAGALTEEERDDLLRTARRLMERSVAVGRARGLGAVEMHAHGRAGRPCHRCGTPISVGSANEKPYERPVFWCPTCQAPDARQN
ncbi:DNA-formamidopyrimidine glycosylase family protein [Promicromonospora sp. NPDC050249]|uniref:DNA-formamidopyrimidine glycosylase family protein n=1 Tax=Promicromonospora sp. NPDC050249 TaxID=3154743 RepID=UPI0033E8D1A5